LRAGSRKRLGALCPAGRDRVEESARERLLAVRHGGFFDRFVLCGAHTSSLSPPPIVGNVVILIDLILVVVFCVIGRISHEEGVFGDLPGLLGTIWPFVVAAVIAHLALLVARRPHRERM